MDNLTKYRDLEQLNDTDAESTILQMKKIFARQGVPEVVISDNGPQYASKEFKEFSESWNFHHYTSSPHHPKGNGTAEAAVKQAKRILKMSHASSIIRASVKKKQQNKRYHDKRAKLLPPLVVGDSIHAKIRPQSSPLWTQGRVVRRESDRSYIVKADGREYRRNRCHIRKTREMTTPKVVVTNPYLDSPVSPPTQSDVALPTAPQPKFIELLVVNNETGQMQLSDIKNESKSEPVPIRQGVRRSQRQVKPNSKYKDFVLFK